MSHIRSSLQSVNPAIRSRPARRPESERVCSDGELGLDRPQNVTSDTKIPDRIRACAPGPGGRSVVCGLVADISFVCSKSPHPHPPRRPHRDGTDTPWHCALGRNNPESVVLPLHHSARLPDKCHRQTNPRQSNRLEPAFSGRRGVPRIVTLFFQHFADDRQELVRGKWLS